MLLRLTLALPVFLIGSLAITSADDQRSAAPEFSSTGDLLRPDNYREWVWVSSGLGMTYGPHAQAAADPRFDNVFVTPVAYRAFQQTGRWPEKTMFILEIRNSVGKSSINEAGHFQGSLTAVEAEVKDSSRFPTKWAFFDLGTTGKSGRQIPAAASCYSCHAQNAAVDNTFVQFYPTLLETAKQKGIVK